MNWPRLESYIFFSSFCMSPPLKDTFKIAPAVVAKRLVMQLQKSPYFVTDNVPWDRICTCLVSPKGFLLSYALNCKAAVIWCNLSSINIAFFPSSLLPLLFSLLGCFSPIHSLFTSGCLWDPAIKALGAVLLIRLRNPPLPPSLPPPMAVSSGWKRSPG